MIYRPRMRTIEGILPALPKEAMYTPYVLNSDDNRLCQFMGKWYFNVF